jgi:hypothetical protein
MGIDTSFDFILIGDNMIPCALNYSIMGVEYILGADDNDDEFILKGDNNENENNYLSTLGCDGIDYGLGISINFPNFNSQDYGIELWGDGSESDDPEFFILDLYNF